MEDSPILFFLSLTLICVIIAFFIHDRKKLLNQKNLIHIDWGIALEGLDDPIILSDLEDNLVHANKAFYTLINKTKDEVVGKKVHLLIHNDDSYKQCEACSHRFQLKDGIITREANDKSNPLNKPVEIIIRKIQNEKNETIGILQSFHDISHLRLAENKLRNTQANLYEAQRIAHMGNWIWDIEEDIFEWSEEMWRIFGCPDIPDNKSTYVYFMQHIHNEDRNKVRDVIQSAIKNKSGSFSINHRISLSDGKTRIISHQGKLVFQDSQCVRIAGVTQDITKQKLIEQALQKEKEKAEVTLQSIGDAVLTINVNGEIDYANPVAEQLLMLKKENILGQHHKKVLHLVDEKTLKPIADPVVNSLDNKKDIFHDQILLMRPDKTQFSVSISAAPIIVEDKVITGVTLVIHDVTDMRNLAKRLSFQASHDELTGLVNRREFEIRLDNAIVSAQTQNKIHALIYMDLDQFKIVNDTCGHIAGDELLKQISNILTSRIRDEDTLARLGGDEFAVLILSCPAKVSKSIAENLRKSIEEYRFVWEEKIFKVGVSIGLIPITSKSIDQIDILKKADTACYVAKDSGRNQVYVYENDTRLLDHHHGEMQWAQRINQSIENNQFELFCQTIKPLKKEATDVHFEILLRMTDANGNYIQPYSFIPAAERYHLMPAVDKWVLTNTLDILQAMDEKLNWDKYICAINLSGQSLSDPSFLDFIITRLDNSDINPHHICFEITETTAIANLANAARFINILRDMGIKFSLDDFGSGLSSFDYLKNLEIDFLKIDGVFVKDIVHDNIDLAMVKSINEIGHLMGVETIAEFVENMEILKICKKMGIDYGQGAYIGNPIPLKQYLELNTRKKIS